MRVFRLRLASCPFYATLQRRFLFLSFVGLTSVFFCASAPPPELLLLGTPEDVGVSSGRLARIDAMLRRAIADDEIPGAVALVARKGRIIYHQALGSAEPERGRALQVDDIFRIASMTKAITSTAVMMLWEEGHFKLDDPVSRWIPEFESTGVFASLDNDRMAWTTITVNTPITIRHLLTHTSGIGYGMIDDDPRFRKMYKHLGIVDAWTTEPITIEENVRKLATLPLHFHPGEKYSYSEGLDVLGYYIELISGLSFAEFLEKRLFKPLGMEDTHFYLSQEKAERLVPVLRKAASGRWERYQASHYDVDFPVKGAKTFFSGGGGLCSTAKDYAAFLQMYLNRGQYGGKQILSPTTVKTVMEDQVGNRWNNRERHYGLAFGVVNEQGKATGGMGAQGTFDWGGYFNTQFFADPKEQLIGVLLKQTRGGGDSTGWRFRQMVAAAIAD